jgi:hypothetical protein
MLANRAYWLVHHDVTGGLQTSKRAADRVIAAAMLAELIGQGAIGVESDRVQVYTPAPRTPATASSTSASGTPTSATRSPHTTGRRSSPYGGPPNPDSPHPRNDGPRTDTSCRRPRTTDGAEPDGRRRGAQAPAPRRAARSTTPDTARTDQLDEVISCSRRSMAPPRLATARPTSSSNRTATATQRSPVKRLRECGGRTSPTALGSNGESAGLQSAWPSPRSVACRDPWPRLPALRAYERIANSPVSHLPFRDNAARDPIAGRRAR